MEYTAEQAAVINDLVLNRAYCLEISGKDALCDPLLGDETTPYSDHFMVFQRNDKWYTVIEGNINGNNRRLTDELLDALKDKFGRDKVRPVSDLPQEEGEL